MTENEVAIKTLEAMKKQFLGETRDIIDRAIQAIEEVQQYRAIGTVEELQALKEKSVAKKVVTKGQGHEADCYCPNCNTFLGSDQDWCFNQTKYCNECGQALENLIGNERRRYGRRIRKDLRKLRV